MSYKIDGSSHKNGIKSEKNSLSFFNDKKNFIYIKKCIESYNKKILNNSFDFEKMGGTKNRSDFIDITNNIKISLKSKKKENNKYKGTFDLINTPITFLKNSKNTKLEEKINEYETWIKFCKENLNSITKSMIIEKNKFYCNLILNSITGEDIKYVFNKIYKMEKGIIDIIRDYKFNIDEEIFIKDIHFLKHNWFLYELENNINLNQNIISTKNSSFIKNKDGSNSIFRVRIVLNNGIEAFLRHIGLNPKIQGKNNSSVLTIKIQVDKVNEVVEKYKINKYEEK